MNCSKTFIYCNIIKAQFYIIHSLLEDMKERKCCISKVSKYTCTVFILINAPSLINVPSLFLWEKCGQMPYKMASRHWNFGIFAHILSEQTSFLGLWHCSVPGAFIRITTVLRMKCDIKFWRLSLRIFPLNSTLILHFKLVTSPMYTWFCPDLGPNVKI